MTTNYTENSIVTMPFGESVRKKLGMYLSADKEQALRLGLRELVYNSQDEYEQGFGNTIDIVINTKDRLISISDNARGIPCGIREDGVNSLVAACTLPHSGAKHDTEVYAGAVGINGIGLKVVCHTSENFHIVSSRNPKSGLANEFIFTETEQGAVLNSEKEIKVSKTSATGTSIKYVPSKIIYGDAWLDKEELFNDMRELSYFAKGLKITVDFDGDKKVFLSKNGLADALANKKAVHKNILYFNKEVDGVRVELALQWTKDCANLMPYANNLNVPEGGAFITGFKTSLTKAFNTALGTDFSGEIIRKYLDGYVSVKVAMPQFSNQAKTALANPEARTACAKATTDAIKEFFAKNKKDGEQIKELLEKEQKAEKAAQRAREAEKTIVTGKKVKMLTNLPPKLADATGKGYRELFLTEGNSASGTLKKVRDPYTQGVLSLRGKVLNTHDEELADILKNQEIKDIISAIGAGVGSTVNVKNSRYDKIILATDQDADGSHITVLLMTLFLYHMRPIVEAGMVYKVQTPLYRVKTKGGDKYFYSDKELQDYADMYGLPAHYDRYKGLGALTEEQTEEVLANADSRVLVQMKTTDMEKTLQIYDAMMGNNLDARRNLILTKGEMYEQYK